MCPIGFFEFPYNIGEREKKTAKKIKKETMGTNVKSVLFCTTALFLWCYILYFISLEKTDGQK